MAEANYLKVLVEDVHSTAVATIGADGRPQTRIIDMMLWDAQGVYFLTARGKAFFQQLMDQRFIAVSATKDKKAVSLRGKVRGIGHQKLDEVFEKNAYMQAIYPGNTRDTLEVFHLYEAEGEFFDIGDPSNVTRASIVIGGAGLTESGYFIGDGCIGCKLCHTACPQQCIDVSGIPAVIDQNHCLRCGRCTEACAQRAIAQKGQA